MERPNSVLFSIKSLPRKWAWDWAWDRNSGVIHSEARGHAVVEVEDKVWPKVEQAKWKIKNMVLAILRKEFLDD